MRSESGIFTIFSIKEICFDKPWFMIVCLLVLGGNLCWVSPAVITIFLFISPFFRDSTCIKGLW